MGRRGMNVRGRHFPTFPYLPSVCLRRVTRGTGSGIGVELMHIMMHVIRMITEDQCVQSSSAGIMMSQTGQLSSAWTMWWAVL